MQKKGVKLLATNQIILIITFVIATAFLIGQTNIASAALADPSATTLPARTPIPPGTGAEPGFFSKLYGGELFGATPGGFGSALMQGAAWGITLYFASSLITSFLGLEEGLANAINTAVGVGSFTGFFAGNLATGSTPLGLTPGTFGPLIGISAAVIVFVLLYSEETAKRVEFQCLPWEAPVGGQNCEECNNDPYRPCSEYRCRSLGQACELVNEGTAEEQCVWVNEKDVRPPTITPWQEALTENHDYTNHETRPSSKGTKIVRTEVSNGCLQAFTPLKFGITLNEPAQCKIDTAHKNTFEEMSYYLDNNNFYLYNHTQQMSLPSPDSVNAEAPELQNDGTYQMFIRCRDKNGNENVDEYAVQFCVDPSPDTTAPIIVDTSIKTGSPVSHNVENVPVEIYVNEPSTCKWSVQDKNYDDLENEMTCATSLTQVNARELYTCTTTLSGIQNNAENNYYFRCRDQPTKPEQDRNTNVQSHKLTLLGSQPLNILEVGPNETMTGSTQTINTELTVVTDDGAEEGVAMCYFSSTGVEGSYVLMFETNSHTHSQTLQLTTGTYEYHLRCVDLGGNSAQATTNFEVIVDTNPPLVTRAYHFLDTLKLITDENAQCYYSLNNCNYNIEEGIKLLQNPPSNKEQHFAEWKPNRAYYVKCQDEFGNAPSPNECSIIVSATSA